MMISDEDLAKIAWDSCNTLEWDSFAVLPGTRQKFIEIARAVRIAVEDESPVTPLAPGEMVTIPDARGSDFDGLFVVPTAVPGRLAVGRKVLDAAGVQTLIDAARRWQAAQEGDHD